MLLLSHFSKFVYCFEMSACVSNSNKFSPQQRVGETSIFPRRNNEGKKDDTNWFFIEQIYLSTIFSSNCRKLTKYCESAAHAMAKQRNIASVFIISRKRFLCVCANYWKRKYGHIPKTSRSQGPSFLQITIALEKKYVQKCYAGYKKIKYRDGISKAQEPFLI